jgi:PAS domain S-box-containing protein
MKAVGKVCYNNGTQILAILNYSNEEVLATSMEQLKLEQTNHLWEFIEYLAEGVLVLDHNLMVVAANQAVERMLGWKGSELIGRYCQNILCCQDLATNTPLCQNLCPLMALHRNSPNKLPHFQELSVATKSGERRKISISFAPLKSPVSVNNKVEPANGSPTITVVESPEYSLMLLRDISEEKRQEIIKTQFITTASHQLRTPLASIKTAIGLLLDNVGESVSPPLLKLLVNIRESSLRMERLVNDLIELTNLQTGRVQIQQRRVAVKELVRRAVELSQTRLEAKRQTLELKLPEKELYLETDLGRIGQILGHLLSNACKFSNMGKKIELEVKASVDAQNSPVVVFSVKDEGVGIATEEKGLIFEKFYQSQIIENSNEIGNGLGLPLARALVELNGGKLWFESELGKGSVFYFSLPALQTNICDGYKT